jgi:hypothetical protein
MVCGYLERGHSVRSVHAGVCEGETSLNDFVPKVIRFEDRRTTPIPTLGLKITEIPRRRLACRAWFEWLVPSTSSSNVVAF